jgi:hypothetical protein
VPLSPGIFYDFAFYINGNQIGLNMSSFHEKYAQMFLLNSVDGKIIKNKMNN